MERAAFDAEMMRIALRVAERGLGQTAPNPAVGAVVADEKTGEVISRGWTQPGGRPHAETEAIRRAGVRARGATLYVTLEPCAHFGKTPPCADAIVVAGLSRVVAGVSDPDPRTAGQGIAILRVAGIEVSEGVLGDEARWLALGHILRVTENRPFVQIKMALAGDGAVHRGHNGWPVMVTGAVARAQGHLMRAQADAILIGRKTVMDDDPALTCRLPGLTSRSPVRVILTSSARDLGGSALAQSARDVPLWIFFGPDARSDDVAILKDKGARVFPVQLKAGRVAIGSVVATLAEQGITRLLVEGGPEVWRSFDDARLVDEAVVFQVKAAGSTPHTINPVETLRRWLTDPALALAQSHRIGDDLCHIFRRI